MAESAIIGCRVKIVFAGKKMLGLVLATSEKSDYEESKIRSVLSVHDDTALIAADDIKLATWMAQYYFCSLGEALFAMIPSAKREKAMDSLWDIKLDSNDSTLIKKNDIVFSQEQQDAIDTLKQSQGGNFYLYGITGSGKTMVYLELVKKILAENKSVIYLVPEISLVHQSLEQIQHYFHKDPQTQIKLAVLHSHLTPSQRLKEWRRIQKGEANVIVGPRSAIFAPVQNLGAVIIDEEHENSYKSGQVPRYGARQVAMKKLSYHPHSFLLLGSATPSLEAWHYMHAGDLQCLRLQKRIGNARLAVPTIVNMQGSKEVLSPLLKQRLLDIVAEKQQAILFLNRRGYSYYYHCKSCGYEVQCKNCSIALTYHHEKQLMLCHYCGYSCPTPTFCPECQSYDMHYSGMGIEFVEQEVKRLLGAEHVARLDTDVAKDKKQVVLTIKKFKEKEILVLLGTQMIAKGLNFPGVKLVGLIMADASLNLPDFRASERTFSLIQQISGRAGRYRDDGEVILQTYKPDSPIIKWAVDYDNTAFYEEEIASRKELFYPPYVRLFRLVMRGPHEEKVKHEIDTLAHYLGQWDVQYLGPVQCPIAKIANSFRYHILIKSQDFRKTHQTISHLLSLYKTPANYYLEIDIDPNSTM